jgi:hypothetical protein
VVTGDHAGFSETWGVWVDVSGGGAWGCVPTSVGPGRKAALELTIPLEPRLSGAEFKSQYSSPRNQKKEMRTNFGLIERYDSSDLPSNPK